MCGYCQCSTCARTGVETRRTDTDARLEAARCGETRPVPVKTVKPTRILADTREESIYAAFIVDLLSDPTRVQLLGGLRPTETSISQDHVAEPHRGRVGPRC